MNEIRFQNPVTGELLVHREREGRRELLFDIRGDRGAEHSHAVWNDGQLSFLRDVRSSCITDDRFRE